MNKEQFITELEKLNISYNNKMLEKLESYFNLLIETNKNINLTAITKKEDVYLKHFYDSLTIVKAIDLKKIETVCDVGTGAGFPGIVLKIFFPNLNITLLDSLDKRIKFLNLVIEKLKLKTIKAVHSRIEEYEKKEQYDLVVSRAVAYTPTLLELSCQLPKINGRIILLKGNVDKEIKESKNAIKTLNYKLNNIYNFKLPIENSERNIVVLTKIKSTPSLYPRQYTQIKKKAL